MKTALSFVFGILIGVFVTGWISLGGERPPEAQETNVRDLTFSNLKSEDSWLLDSQPHLVPLTGIRSACKYAILIFTPSAKGVATAPNRATWLNLETKDGTQPIHISSNDFGPKGDHVVVKFIDESGSLFQMYSADTPMTLTSQP